MPFRLRRWRRADSSDRIQFFTCARPGRSKGVDRPVPNDLVRRWVKGLPGGGNTTLVSLLGRKHGPEGVSKFSFYSFWGGFDQPSERRARPSFQQWLDRYCAASSIQLIEHPTYDFRPIPPETVGAVISDICKLLSAGRTVILVDSGGETRAKKSLRLWRFHRRQCVIGRNTRPNRDHGPTSLTPRLRRDPLPQGGEGMEARVFLQHSSCRLTVLYRLKIADKIEG
jgi:hypothetical protein